MVKVEQPNGVRNGSVFSARCLMSSIPDNTVKTLTSAIKGQPLSFQPSVPKISGYLIDIYLGYACIIVAVVMWWKNDRCKGTVSTYFAREAC